MGLSKRNDMLIGQAVFEASDGGQDTFAAISRTPSEGHSSHDGTESAAIGAGLETGALAGSKLCQGKR